MKTPIEGDIVPPDEVTPVDEKKVLSDEKKVRQGFWKTFKKAARFIPFSDEVVAAYFCALDPRTPLQARATLLGALAYFVLPIDLVPDFIVALGFSDDITVLTAALMRFRRFITDEHREKARQELED